MSENQQETQNTQEEHTAPVLTLKSETADKMQLENTAQMLEQAEAVPAPQDAAQIVAGPEPALEHAAAADAADVVAPGERADLHAEGSLAVHDRRRRAALGQNGIGAFFFGSSLNS